MKILVVGAGPAGLSTAINAAKEGNEVLVYEKDSCLGSKVCGEALAREALDFVDLKPSKNFIKNYVEGFSISFKGEFIREAKFEKLTYAPGYVVDKAAFLEAMHEKAQANGAKVIFNRRVEKVEAVGRILLRGGESVRGDLVVCADGVGTLARAFLDYSGYRIATTLQYRCTMPDSLNPHSLYLDIVGDGYEWVFPKGDCANVGIGLPRGCSIENLRSNLNNYVRKLGVKTIGKIMSAPVCIGGPLKRFSSGKVAVAGESAGCVMPISGEGTRFAMYGGSLAWLPDYRRKFMDKYGSNMARSLRMLSLVSRLSDASRLELLRSLEKPIDMLEGKRVDLSKFLFKPRLLKELFATRHGVG